MALELRHITTGPDQHDLELAIVSRNLGAVAKFTIYIEGEPAVVDFRVFNFSFVTCHGPNYKLGGRLVGDPSIKEKLPAHNWIFVEYNTEQRQGKIEFSNAE